MAFEGQIFSDAPKKDKFKMFLAHEIFGCLPRLNMSFKAETYQCDRGVNQIFGLISFMFASFNHIEMLFFFFIFSFGYPLQAYVQQLESSRLKLTQLEQELQRARQQVCAFFLVCFFTGYFFCFVIQCVSSNAGNFHFKLW